MIFQYEVEATYLGPKRPYRTLLGICKTLEKAQSLCRNAIFWSRDIHNAQWHSHSGNLQDKSIVDYIITETIPNTHLEYLHWLRNGMPKQFEYGNMTILNQLVNADLLTMESAIFRTFYRITPKGKTIAKHYHKGEMSR